MIDTREIGAGSYPEPDWCNEDIGEDELPEDYDMLYADYIHEKMILED